MSNETVAQSSERGTFACSICGLASPHNHTDEEVRRHRTPPVAWIDNSGHPRHQLYLQSAKERELYGPLRPLFEVPAGLLDRIKAAEQRVQDDRAPRSIPADPHSDVDLVLAEVRYLIEGNWPPFWIAPAPCITCAANHYCPEHNPAPASNAGVSASPPQTFSQHTPMTSRQAGSSF
jgi:hypothetical protein